MTRGSEQLSPELQAYLRAHSAPPDQVLTDLAEETARDFPGSAGMQIGAEQGTLMTQLARLTGARTAVEVGTFTGYSAICIARGLTGDGRLTCCDISEEWTSVARRYWQRAGLADRIELALAPALDTLAALPPGPHLDLAFIDADKPGYIGYWEQIVPRIRPNGLILVDNTMFHGQVVNPDDTSANVAGIREFNDHALADDRVELVMLPIGDGLTLARRK
ncbi:MAG: O-methyltransferase [Streptosporangiaceae bacterium]